MAGKENLDIRVRLQRAREAAKGLMGVSKAAKETGRQVDTAGRKARTASRGFALFSRRHDIMRSGLRKGIGTFRRAAGAATGMVAAFAGIAGIKKAVSATVDLAKTTLTLSKSFGLNVKEASEWAAVSKVRGAEGKQLTMGFKSLAKQADAAAKGGSKQASAFKDLGIAHVDLVKNRNNMHGLLQLVAQGMGKMEAGPRKAAISATLFGRTWTAIAPLIRNGSKEMDKNLKLADKYGATFDDMSLNQLQSFIKQQREAKLATLGLQVAFGKHVAPTLTKLILLFTKFVSGLRGNKGLANTFKDIGEAVKPLGPFLKNVVGPLVIGAFKAFIGTVKGLSLILGFIGQKAKPLAPLFRGIGAVLVLVFGGAIAKGISWVARGLSRLGVIGKLIAVPLRVLARVVRGVGRAFNWFGVRGKAVILAVGSVASALGGKIASVFRTIVGVVKAAPGKIAAAAKGMFNGIREAFRSAINWIIDRWNGIEFHVPGFDPPGPGPKFGGFTIGLPDIPHLATGGVVGMGGRAFVGDAGPELLENTPSGARVTPLSSGTAVGGPGGSLRDALNVLVRSQLVVDGRVLAEATGRAASDREARR